MRKYGPAHGTKSQLSSDDGKDGENEVKEGCVRFQCCANNPVSDVADWNSLRSIRSLGEKSGSIKPSHKQYEKLITNLDNEVTGLGGLPLQKLVHGMWCSIGLLFTNTDWLNHWKVSSKEHLTKLKKDPLFDKTRSGQTDPLCALPIGDHPCRQNQRGPHCKQGRRANMPSRRT
jgi:hypothetical protein